MAFEDSPCPHCGHRRKRYLMSTDPTAPGLGGLLRGEGDPFMQRVAVAAVVFVVAAIVYALVA